MSEPIVTENIPLSDLFGVDERLNKIESDIQKLAHAGQLDSEAGLLTCESVEGLRKSMEYLIRLSELNNQRISQLEQRS
jgi:hypothetical protein